MKATAPGASLDVKASAWELVGIGAVAVANQFSVYGKLGFYQGEVKRCQPDRSRIWQHQGNKH